MWANRITLDFVKHDTARTKIQSKLDEKGATDDWITDLHIFADSGYVGYKVTLSDKSDFTIFDSGKEISVVQNLNKMEKEDLNEVVKYFKEYTSREDGKYYFHKESDNFKIIITPDKELVDKKFKELTR